MAGDDISVGLKDSSATPATSGKRPYLIVLVADFGSVGRLNRLASVDKDEFARVLQRAKPEAAIALKDPFGGGPDWEFKVAFDSIGAFGPAGLLAQIPGARERLDIRSKIAARQTGSIGTQDLEAALSTVASRHPSLSWLAAGGSDADGGATGSSAGDDAGGSSLLDMVDAPNEQSRVEADIARVVAAAGDQTARVSGAEGGRLVGMLARLDKELTAIAGAVLKHADVRRLEQAWRGLKLLVDRIDFREGTRLAIVDSPRTEAVARFVEQVVTPAFNSDIPTPGLVLWDYASVNSPADIALLDELAQQAASLPVPVAVPLEPMFFNVKTVALIKNLPELKSLVDEWQFAKWRALRDKPYSRALLPILGKFVLRAPYGVDAAAGGGRKGEFSLVEPLGSANDLLWGGGHLAMGVCAARSYAKHGWPTRMFGAEAGKLEDLPVVHRAGATAGTEDAWGPGDALLPDRKVQEFADIGVNLLHAVKNRDYCILLGGVSAGRPKKTAEVSDNQAMLEVSMPYQQFSNIISTFLCEEQPKLHGLPADEIQKRLLFGLRDLMGLGDDEEKEAVMIGVGAAPDQPGKTVVAVRLSPPARIVPGGLFVEMGFAVGS